MNLSDLIQDAQNKGLISIELNDAQAQFEKLRAEIIKQMNFIAVVASPKHLVPDGQYVQHQDRPAVGFPSARYLIQERTLCLN